MGRFVLFKQQYYRSLASMYRRNRFWVTLLGQTVPVARVYLGLPAGVLGLPLVPFAIAAYLGILLWNVPFLVLGFVLKDGPYSSGHIGLWASCILLTAEIVILVAARTVRLTRRRRNLP